MNDAWTPEEFAQLLAPWDVRMKAVAMERLERTSKPLQNFDTKQERTLRAVLALLIPQREKIDICGLVDETLGDSQGRGDRSPSLPPIPDLIRNGLEALDEAAGGSFAEADPENQLELLRKVSRGEQKGGLFDETPSQEFFLRLMSKALHGYLSHPRAWMRIGFMGASYPEGCVWLSKAEVRQRHRREPGWDRL